MQISRFGFQRSTSACFLLESAQIFTALLVFETKLRPFLASAVRTSTLILSLSRFLLLLRLLFLLLLFRLLQPLFPSLSLNLTLIHESVSSLSHPIHDLVSIPPVSSPLMESLALTIKGSLSSPLNAMENVSNKKNSASFCLQRGEYGISSSSVPKKNKTRKQRQCHTSAAQWICGHTHRARLVAAEPWNQRLSGILHSVKACSCCSDLSRGGKPYGTHTAITDKSKP